MRDLVLKGPVQHDAKSHSVCCCEHSQYAVHSQTDTVTHLDTPFSTPVFVPQPAMKLDFAVLHLSLLPLEMQFTILDACDM